ncbi:MAG: ABC transporter ATP-binding protein [Gracilibacteraceae bacterium]|jgi:putative ABC transport system ATP-binding protein|nr:ABC transporter ATP-binding protein [Gracilibacteraceae bacterium]
MSTALELTNLCKTYVANKRQNHVLKNVCMTIEQGEMAAVMGPSGAGKTTLLHAISSIERPTAGRVIFFGKDITGLKEKKLSDIRLKEMGFVFQDMYMLRNLTVEDNILLPGYQAAKEKGVEGRRRIDERCCELMSKMGIDKIATHDITEISGGEMQRACICRSLINSPKMIFADEPTGSLNKKASNGVIEELLRVNREGTTIMLVTHDVRVAAACDRVLYIIDGQIPDDYELGKYEGGRILRERERELNTWLLDLGW